MGNGIHARSDVLDDGSLWRLRGCGQEEVGKGGRRPSSPSSLELNRKPYTSDVLSLCQPRSPICRWLSQPQSHTDVLRCKKKKKKYSCVFLDKRETGSPILRVHSSVTGGTMLLGQSRKLHHKTLHGEWATGFCHTWVAARTGHGLLPGLMTCWALTG